MNTADRIILACGILLNLWLLHALARKLFARPLQPMLRGKGIVPTIGRDKALNNALHARLSLPAARPLNRVVKGWGRTHGPVLLALLIKAAQCAAIAAVVLTWGLMLAACFADEPRWP